MAPPFEILLLSREDTLEMAVMFADLRRRFPHVSRAGFSEELREWLARALRAYPGGLFVKTGYGTFKQNPAGLRPVRSFDDFNSVVRWTDTRIERYLRNRLVTGSKASLAASAWRHIPPQSEFRAFIRHRKIHGISQYHCRQFFPEIADHAEAINAALRAFLEKLTAVLHLDHVTADVCLQQEDDGRYVVTLTELNPYLFCADPCLFSWENEDDWNGAFRCVTAPSQLILPRDSP